MTRPASGPRTFHLRHVVAPRLKIGLEIAARRLNQSFERDENQVTASNFPCAPHNRDGEAVDVDANSGWCLWGSCSKYS